MQDSLSSEQTELLDPSVPTERKWQIRRRRALRWWVGTGVLMVAVVLLFPLALFVQAVYAYILKFLAFLFG